MRRLYASLAMLMAFSGAPAWAQAPKSAPPAASDVKLHIQEHKLPNGLRMLMLEDHKAPVVTFQVWYQVGSKDERPGITGTSHLLEHMLFQGAKKYGTGQFDQVLTRNGGENNAFTSEDFTAYYEVFASDRLELAFDLESDRMMGALLPAEKLASEKNVVKEERRWRSENSPIGAVWESLMAHSYIAHPYHWPVDGWMSDLEAVTRDQVVEYYRTYYRPDNATLVIVGDFEPSDAIRLAGKYFGGQQAAGSFPRTPTQEPPQDGERRVTLHKDVQTPLVMAAYKLPKAGHPDLYALDVLDTIMSSGESSRFYQELVYKGRLAQQVGSGMSEGKDGSLFYLYAMPMPNQKPEALEKAMYAQIERLQTKPVTDLELKKALNVAEAGFIFEQQSSQNLATSIGTRDALTTYADFNQYLPRLRAVTKQDLMRVAKTYLTTKNRTVVTLRAEEK